MIYRYCILNRLRSFKCLFFLLRSVSVSYMWRVIILYSSIIFYDKVDVNKLIKLLFDNIYTTCMLLQFIKRIQISSLLFWYRNIGSNFLNFSQINRSVHRVWLVRCGRYHITPRTDDRRVSPRVVPSRFIPWRGHSSNVHLIVKCTAA